MFAVYVNNPGCIPYADAIVGGYKPIETRTRDMLGKLVGERVAIIRTGRHRPAEIVGYVTITAKSYHTAAELEDMRDLTLIPPGSMFDCTGKGKWCYHLSDPESCDPIRLDTLHIVRRNRSFCVIDA